MDDRNSAAISVAQLSYDEKAACQTEDSEMLDSPAVTQALARHPLLADSSDNSASSSRLCTLVGQRLQSLTVEHQSTGGQCNVFTSASLPGISIPDYARRLLELTRCSAVCAAYAVVYVQRLVRFKALALTPLAIHRAFLGSMVLAIKFLDDDLCSHTHYAKVGGVTTAALHELEMRTFAALDYRLRVAPAELFIVLDQEA